jgi:uncharacterized protein YfaS (alpha-2-macroglobulin family)
MNLRSRLARAGLMAVAASTCLALVLALPDESRKKTTSDYLGGTARFVSHVSTDKPIYRPGETIYVRGVLFGALDGKPLASGTVAYPRVEIRGPKGDRVAIGGTSFAESVAAFSWPIPDDQPGGEYTIHLRFPHTGYAPAERKIDIRAFRAPRLKSQVVFVRKGYGPGDMVAASVHVERAEGGIPAGAKVRVVARVDGAVVHRGQTVIDKKGNAETRFTLPEMIERGEGVLSFVVEDGGVVESATKTIPILLQTLDLVFYPESGDLVAGLPCRVYVEARTPSQKPADLVGHVVDSSGRKVAELRTEHEGRGRFDLTPRADEAYRLKIIEPAGITASFALPRVASTGTILRAKNDSYTSGASVKLDLASTEKGKLTLVLARREQEIARKSIEQYDVGLTTFELTPPASAEGVLVATVYDENDLPLAERLIFRRPAKAVHVKISADRETYVPGDKVSLTVETTDESGQPVSAVVGLSVTDDSVLEMIDKREQTPRLPVMAFFEGDVRELADAHVYLDPENDQAPRAVDLLLATQGWRRYAFVDTAEFLATNGDDARRVLALRVVTERDRTTARARGRFERLKALGLAGAPVRVARNAVPRRAVEDPQAAVPKDEKAAENGAKKIDAAKRNAKDARGGGRFRHGLRGKRAPAEKRPASRFGEAAEKADREIDRDRLFEADFGKTQPSQMLLVRIYAHAVRPDRRPADRVDFSETLYWNAGVRTDETSGKSTVTFDLSDSVTSFRVFADAFDTRGALGTGTSLIESVEPFYLEPKLPLEVTVGDRVLLPLALVNGTQKDLADGVLNITASRGIDIDVDGSTKFALAGNARNRVLVPIDILAVTSEGKIVVQAAVGPFSDRVTRELRVVPSGFPIEVAQGGKLAANSSLTWIVEIPEDVVPGSVTTDAAVYASPAASLAQALERLLREPHGCFEQTSSTNYPLTMAQQYFTTHAGVDPALVEKGAKLLDKGYKRLIGFECKKKGYEWFGADPGHEALTAYGLFEFTDMAKVTEVDAGMLERTRAWLMACRDGKGNFSRKRRALHTWVTDQDASNGYILWSLLECGQSPQTLGKEISHFLESAVRGKNSYVTALGALVAGLANDQASATKLRKRLAESLTKDGFVDGATGSIVGSGGEALRIETTSLAILAWLDAEKHAGHIELAMRWIAESCKAGRYGSTQSTVLALRAIVEYDKRRSSVTSAGKLRIFVDGHQVGETVEFDKDSQSALALPDFSEMLHAGKHQVELRMEGGSSLPFALAVNFHRTVPNSSEACQLRIETTLSDAKVTEGEATEANIVVTSLSDAGVPNPVAIVGIPGGLEVRHDQLKELVKAGRIAAYEVIGRDVVLYWRGLEPNARVELPLSLVAAIPGKYTGNASRSYLYYTDEHKTWAAPLAVEILPTK